MRIMIAIPNYSKKQSDIYMLNRCIKSILQYEPKMKDDIVVFDDHSPFFDPGLVNCNLVVMNGKNKGYAGMVNQAIDYAKNLKYDVVITVNTDIEVLTPFKDRLTKVFRYDQRIGIIGAMLLFPTGRIQSAGFECDKNGTPHEFFKTEIFAHDPNKYSNPAFVFGVTGAFQAIRLSATDIIGKYDEAFKLSYEDVEFCYRAWRDGYKVFYDPFIKAIHAESVSRGYHVGQREYDSYRRWVKLKSADTIDQVRSSVALANLLVQSKSSAPQSV
jgi:GT2 family glycosyltransferase